MGDQIFFLGTSSWRSNPGQNLRTFGQATGSDGGSHAWAEFPGVFFLSYRKIR